VISGLLCTHNKCWRKCNYCICIKTCPSDGIVWDGWISDNTM